MIDMLFVTDKKSMNLIVNYNMLKSPSELQSERRMRAQDTTLERRVESIKNQIQLNKASICAPANRPLAKMQVNIFAPYKAALH
jgi:hypothetical protein